MSRVLSSKVACPNRLARWATNVHANQLCCLYSSFAVIASESTKQAARFPADQPQKHSLFVL
jgi:hypothetical protein